MLNKIGRRFIAAIACVMLVLGICFSNSGFISTAAVARSDESEDEHADEAKATISQEDFKLRAMGVSKAGVSFSHETSFLDLVMDSAAGLSEKSFYEDKVAANTEPYLTIRESDNESSEAVGKLYPASYGTIIEQGEEWTKITSGCVTGYVRNEHVLFADDAEAIAEELGTEAIIVNSEEANIHSSEDASSEVITQASADTAYNIVMPEEEETADDTETGEATVSNVEKAKALYPEWVPVAYAEEQVGYVSADDVTVIMALKEAVSLEEEQQALQAATAKETTDETKETQPSGTQTSVEPERVEETKASGNSGSTASEASNTSVATTSSDEYLLACLVYCEAGNQSYEGQLAVANVVINRVNSSGFANSISGVIYESGQFSPASNGSLAKALNNGPSSSAIQAAKDALAGNNNIGDYLYFNGYVDTSSVGSYTVIGDHTFYKY